MMKPQEIRDLGEEVERATQCTLDIPLSDEQSGFQFDFKLWVLDYLFRSSLEEMKDSYMDHYTIAFVVE